MNCKGCNFAFNANNRKPLILVGCGHSVCRLCILQLKEQCENEAQEASIYHVTSAPKKLEENKFKQSSSLQLADIEPKPKQ